MLEVALPLLNYHALILLMSLELRLVPLLSQLAEQVDQHASHQRYHQPLQNERQDITVDILQVWQHILMVAWLLAGAFRHRVHFPSI